MLLEKGKPWVTTGRKASGLAPHGETAGLPEADVHDRRGVTLLELLIVVTIIGIVTAIVAPRIDLTRIRADTAMQSVGTTLLATQRLAVTRGHDMVILFDEATAALRVHEDADNDGAIDTDERVRRLPLGDQIVFGRGGAPVHPVGAAAVNLLQVREGVPALVFHRNGSASEFGGFYLTTRRAALRSGFARDTRVLQVERSTGRTAWFRYASSGWVQGF